MAFATSVDVEDIVRDSFAMRTDMAQSIETVLAQQTAQTTLLRRLADSHDNVSFTMASQAEELPAVQSALNSARGAITALATALHTESRAAAESRITLAAISARVEAMAGAHGTPDTTDPA